MLVTVLAAATAKPSGVLLPAAAPLAYAAPIAPAAVSYTAPLISAVPAAVSYAAPAPAVAIPPPITYSTGHEVSLTVEPVEQHGYKIAYWNANIITTKC